MFIFNFTDEPASILPVASRGHGEKLLDAMHGAVVIETLEDLAELTGPQLVLLHNALAARIVDGDRPEAVNRFSTRDVAKRRVWAMAQGVRIETQQVLEVIADEDEGLGVTLDQVEAALDTPAQDLIDAAVSNGEIEVVRDGDGPLTAAYAATARPEPIDKLGADVAQAEENVKQNAPFIQEAVDRAKADRAQSSARKSGGTPVINRAPLPKLVAAREKSVQALFIDLLARPEGASFAELREAQHALAASKGSTAWTDQTVASGLGWDVNKVKGYGIETRADGRYHLTYPTGVTAPLPHTALKGKAK